MNWYTEMELHHGTSEWDILREGFLLTFTFEDHWWDTVDDALQAIKVAIFKIPQELMEVLQPDWATQLSCVLECYNVNMRRMMRIHDKLTFQKLKAVARCEDH